MKSKLSVLFAAFVVLIFALCGCKEATFQNHYSTADEIGIGEKESAEIEHSEKMDYDPALNQRVQDIAAPIFSQAQLMRSDVTYKIAIIDSKEKKKWNTEKKQKKT